MEKKNMTGAYQAPEIQVLDVNIEGVLCGSPTGAFDEMTEGGI